MGYSKNSQSVKWLAMFMAVLMVSGWLANQHGVMASVVSTSMKKGGGGGNQPPQESAGAEQSRLPYPSGLPSHVPAEDGQGGPNNSSMNDTQYPRPSDFPSEQGRPPRPSGLPDGDRPIPIEELIATGETIDVVVKVAPEYVPCPGAESDVSCFGLSLLCQLPQFNGSVNPSPLPTVLSEVRNHGGHHNQSDNDSNIDAEETELPEFDRPPRDGIRMVLKGSIDGFTYVAGYEYELNVSVKVVNTPDAGSSLLYIVSRPPRPHDGENGSHDEGEQQGQDHHQEGPHPPREQRAEATEEPIMFLEIPVLVVLNSIVSQAEATALPTATADAAAMDGTTAGLTSTSSSAGLSAGAIAGIVIGSIAMAALAAGLVIYGMRKREANRASEELSVA